MAKSEIVPHYVVKLLMILHLKMFKFIGILNFAEYTAGICMLNAVVTVTVTSYL